MDADTKGAFDVSFEYLRSVLLVSSTFVFVANAGYAQDVGANKSVTPGDGSATDNMYLVVPVEGSSCLPGILCTSPDTVAANKATSAYVHTPAVDVTAVQFTEVGNPNFKTDLAVELRGSFRTNGTTERFDVEMVPWARFKYFGPATEVTGAGELIVAPTADGERYLRGANVSGEVVHKLSSVSLLRGRVDVGYANSANAFDASAYELFGPDTTSASASVDYEHLFGQFEGQARLSGARIVSGQSQLITGDWRDNDQDSYTRIGAAGRLGYNWEEDVQAYGYVNVDQYNFDAESAFYKVSKDYTTVSGVIGLRKSFSQRLVTDAYVGVSQRYYARGDEETGYKAGARLDYTVNDALGLRVSFDSDLSNETTITSTARDYTLSAAANYKINSLLSLQGDVNYTWTSSDVLSDDIERVSFNARGIYAFNDKTEARIGYGYRQKTDRRGNPAYKDEHRLTAGITVRY